MSPTIRALLSLRARSGVLPGLLVVACLLYAAPPVDLAALDCRPATVSAPVAAGMVVHPKGLLWKITPASGRPSWLYGTIHVSSPRVLKLPGPVEAAFTGADNFVMEALFDPTAADQFVQQMYYDDGHHLHDDVGALLGGRAVDLLARYGVPAGLAARMKPWAAFLTLSEPAGDNGEPLDLRLMRRAQGRGVPLYGLETIKEQAAVFGDMPLDAQAQLLHDTLCYYDDMQKQFASLEERYLDRDLAGLKAASDEYGGDGELGRQVMDRLIVQRNRRMAVRMAPRLKEGNAFIAIGALHLPGEDGVLRLLERQGYAVAPVY